MFHRKFAAVILAAAVTGGMTLAARHGVRRQCGVERLRGRPGIRRQRRRSRVSGRVLGRLRGRLWERLWPPVWRPGRPSVLPALLSGARRLPRPGSSTRRQSSIPSRSTRRGPSSCLRRSGAARVTASTAPLTEPADPGSGRGTPHPRSRPKRAASRPARPARPPDAPTPSRPAASPPRRARSAPPCRRRA